MVALFCCNNPNAQFHYETYIRAMDHQGAINHILNRLEKELPEHLSYHGKHHTIDVLETVKRIGEHQGVSEKHQNILSVAAAYHDCGFIFGHTDHELAGCNIAKETLPKYGLDTETVELVCKMIMATKVPQNPTCHLCNMLCDADLDYLGRDDFEPVAKSLYNELNFLGIMKDEMTWNKVQVAFLENHHYHTSFGKEIRQPKKEEHLKVLKALINSYDS